MEVESPTHVQPAVGAYWRHSTRMVPALAGTPLVFSVALVGAWSDYRRRLYPRTHGCLRISFDEGFLVPSRHSRSLILGYQSPQTKPAILHLWQKVATREEMMLGLNSHQGG